MKSDIESVPYASPQNIKFLIARLRDRGWPDPLDSTELTDRLDIPAGSVSRVSSALRFIGLVDDEGHPTDDAKRLREVDDEQYPAILAELVQTAYKDVFYKIADIAAASESELNNAFRLFYPPGQKDRMVTLFKALCQEAELMPEGSPARTRTTPRQPSKKLSVNGGEKKREISSDNQNTPSSNEPSVTSSVRTNANSRYALLHGLIDTLPENGMMTPDEYTSWLNAMTGLYNHLIKKIEPQPKDDA